MRTHPRPCRELVVADRQSATGQGGRPDCQVRESDLYLDSTIPARRGDPNARTLGVVEASVEGSRG